MTAHDANANHAQSAASGAGRLDLRPMPTRIMSLNSSASWECASERAQRRRYDAVLEMEPRTNSIVWMAWWMKASPKENSPPWSSWPPAGASSSSRVE
eukprot:4634079-Prymnesium_polylepis.1